MCEIFALTAKRPIEPDAYLEEFFADSAWNPHGWGLVWYGDQGRELFKEPVQAVESGLLKYVLGWDLCSKLLIAHIRNTTRGTLAYANCHPFEFADSCGRMWSICHNGTIIDETLTSRFGAVQEGCTDTERVSLLLHERLDAAITEKGSLLSFEERFAVLGQLVADLSPSNKLNLAIEDGEYLYIHTNTFQPTLYENVLDDGVVFCSRPIGTEDLWSPVPSCRLLAFRDGKMVEAAPDHGHGFDNDHYLKLIAEGKI